MPTNIDRCSVLLRTIAIAMALGSTPLLAADVTPPAAIADLAAARGATDVSLSWSAVTLDTAGQAESIDRYEIYRGLTPDFVPDTAGGSNRIGTSLTPQFDDVAAVLDGIDYYYLISAVDTSDNESNTKDPLVMTPPTLTGFWTNTTIETQWSGAAPLNEVVSYRVYYGRHSHQYEHVLDVGPATSHSFLGLETNVNWYFAVTAVDVNGNESALSNEHFDPVGGVIRLAAHDEDELCWGAAGCPPAPGRIQRSDGFQILVPVEFPEGDWLSVKVTYTLDSRLCTPPAQGTVSKCGSGNPCPEPPCNGGWNPCGDPWDRIAQLFLVLDDCVAGTGSCLTNDNLELMRAVTPFGTDADPPDGTGVINPRVLTLDVTPFAPLLTGTKYVGAEIVHFTEAGWFVSVDFTFSKKPASASPKPPADGFQIVGLAGAPLPTRTVTIPPEATSVKMRVFTTGHGGSLFCDGGTNNANPCSSSAQCPGGVCNPCDEFCHRTNQMFRDGGLVWSVVPFRTDCSPAGTPCSQWNACGFPSCTFPRAGWCPGYIACHHNAPCDQDFDATALFPPGGTYDVDYSVTPQNGFWPVSVVLYWYE